MLTDAFIKKIYYSVPKKQGFKYGFWLGEVDCNRGRPDIVFAFLADKDGKLGETSESLSKAFTQMTKARIITQLKKSKSISVDDIKQLTGYTIRTIRQHLNELVKLGIVSVNQKQLFNLSHSYKIPDAEIWTFELKVSNWRRAIYQALRYRGFSHYVVVVMPKENIEYAKNNIKIFKNLNVGLATINENGDIQFLKKPRKRLPISESHYLCNLGYILSEFNRLNTNTSSEIE